MFDISKEKPTLTFNGTIKLHGTCASICYNDYNMWVQSRKQIITPLKDNAGFAFFVESKEEKDKLHLSLRDFLIYRFKFTTDLLWNDVKRHPHQMGPVVGINAPKAVIRG